MSASRRSICEGAKASGAQEQKTRCVLKELSSEKEKCIEISVLENVLKMVNH